MAANNKNELPIENLSEEDGAAGTEPTVPVEAADEPQSEDAAPFEPIADDAVTGEEDADTADDGAVADDDLDVSDDPDAGEDFPPAPMRADEFVVPLSWLGEWHHHPRRGSRLFGAHEKALLLSAADPDAPEPTPARPKPIVSIEEEPIVGHDDQPVAACERLADNIDRIRLPDVSGMSLAEREIAADACIGQILRHFELDQRGWEGARRRA